MGRKRSKFWLVIMGLGCISAGVVAAVVVQQFEMIPSATEAQQNVAHEEVTIPGQSWRVDSQGTIWKGDQPIGVWGTDAENIAVFK